MKLPRPTAPIHRDHARPGVAAGGVRPQKITFDAGWDDANNNNVGTYTTATSKAFLESWGTGDLGKAIQHPHCNLHVIKGCHQPNDPHFTVKENGKLCDVDKSSFAGTKSLHVGPC